MNSMAIGVIAGAAGTMALDMTTYGDMAVRGRGSSGTPSEVIRQLANSIGMNQLGNADKDADPDTENRRAALGALSGYLIGLAVGTAYATGRPLFAKVPLGAKALIVGGLAMALSDVPATMLKATNPKKWGAGGWISDVIPHVVYGLVTVAVADRLAGL